MKKIIKSRIFTFILGAIIFGSIGAYAATQYSASQITYNKNGKETVDAALNDLYTKVNKTPTQVATLTTQGATYTMQNDGYVTGTIRSEVNVAAAVILKNSNELNDSNKIFEAPNYSSHDYDISLYLRKGETIYTRQDRGTYNLTVYEWK